MGWTTYVSVFVKDKATYNLEEIQKIAASECDKFLFLPGSELLTLSFVDKSSKEDPYWSAVMEEDRRVGYTQIAFGFCKIQSSINPLLSLCSAMHVDCGIAQRINDNFLVEFGHDYGNQRDARELSALDLALYEILGCLLAPIFFVLNFGVFIEWLQDVFSGRKYR